MCGREKDRRGVRGRTRGEWGVIIFLYYKKLCGKRKEEKKESKSELLLQI